MKYYRQNFQVGKSGRNILRDVGLGDVPDVPEKKM